MYSNKKVYNFEVADWHTYFVGIKSWLVHNIACIKGSLKVISKRLKYLGRTPGKNSKTGREVFDRMLNGKPPTARKYLNEFGDKAKEFWDAGSKKWRDVSQANMGHIEDAVTWWNREG